MLLCRYSCEGTLKARAWVWPVTILPFFPQLPCIIGPEGTDDLPVCWAGRRGSAEQATDGWMDGWMDGWVGGSTPSSPAGQSTCSPLSFLPCEVGC